MSKQENEINYGLVDFFAHMQVNEVTTAHIFRELLLLTDIGAFQTGKAFSAVDPDDKFNAMLLNCSNANQPLYFQLRNKIARALDPCFKKPVDSIAYDERWDLLHGKMMNKAIESIKVKYANSQKQY